MRTPCNRSILTSNKRKIATGMSARKSLQSGWNRISSKKSNREDLH